jgi:hypothetical protein
MFEYLKKGRCYGPISGAELLELVESGVLGPDDLVRRTKELGFHSVRDALTLLHASKEVERSRPAPRLTGSGRASTPGGYTVFTSAPPIPPNPVPRLDALHCDTCGVALSSPGRTCASCSRQRPAAIRCDRCSREYPAGARFCGACGHALA